MSRAAGASLDSILPSVETIRLHGRLYRCVAHLDFIEGAPPRFLYTSGRPGRCNPAGIECVYFSQDERTTHAEYDAWWLGTGSELQPKLVFVAEVELARVIDLSEEATREALCLSDDDLYGTWRGAPEPTRLQAVGAAVSRQTSIGGLRLPSVRARNLGQDGLNVVVYRDAITTPDRLAILGREGRVLERWP